MAKATTTENAALVVLDSLRTLAPDAKENDSDDMAPVVLAAKSLARNTGAAVLLLHHRGHDTMRDFRGSTAIQDVADLLFVLERVDGDPEARWRRRLRCAKCRIAAEPEDRWLAIRSWRGQLTIATAEPYGQAREAPVRNKLADEALEFIRQHGRVSRAAVARGLGRDESDGTTRRALKQLVDTGEVVHDEAGYRVATGQSGQVEGENSAHARQHGEWGAATGDVATLGQDGQGQPWPSGHTPVGGGHDGQAADQGPEARR
jgi:hypothetical protein